MNNVKETDTELLLSTACNLCGKRDGCMPYNDSQLIDGAKNGHVPMKGECGYYFEGTEQSKELALKNLNDFNSYSKNIIEEFGA